MVNTKIIYNAYDKIDKMKAYANHIPSIESLDYVKVVVSELEDLTLVLATDIVKLYRKETEEYQRAIRVLGGV